MIVFLERFIPRDPKPYQVMGWPGASQKICSNLIADLDLLLAGQLPFTPLQFLQRKAQQLPPRSLKGFQQVTVCISLFRYTQKPKTLQDSPSHRILRHMHEVLNIDKKNN